MVRRSLLGGGIWIRSFMILGLFPKKLEGWYYNLPRGLKKCRKISLTDFLAWENWRLRWEEGEQIKRGTSIRRLAVRRRTLSAMHHGNAEHAVHYLSLKFRKKATLKIQEAQVAFKATGLHVITKQVHADGKRNWGQNPEDLQGSELWKMRRNKAKKTRKKGQKKQQENQEGARPGKGIGGQADDQAQLQAGWRRTRAIPLPFAFKFV